MSVHAPIRSLRKIPEGFAKIAQRFNVGDPGGRCMQVPKGRLNSLPQVSFVVGNAVLLEQSQELLLECHLPMVLLLGLDVLDGLFQLRHADTERPIFRLPSKEPVFWEGTWKSRP